MTTSCFLTDEARLGKSGKRLAARGRTGKCTKKMITLQLPPQTGAFVLAGGVNIGRRQRVNPQQPPPYPIPKQVFFVENAT